MRLHACVSWAAASQEDGVASGLHEGDAPPLEHVNWEVFLTLPSARLFWLRRGDVLLMRTPPNSRELEPKPHLGHHSAEICGSPCGSRTRAGPGAASRAICDARIARGTTEASGDSWQGLRAALKPPGRLSFAWGEGNTKPNLFLTMPGRRFTLGHVA